MMLSPPTLLAAVTAIFTLSFGVVSSEGEDPRLAEELKCLNVNPAEQCNLVVTYRQPIDELECDQKVPEDDGSILSQPPTLRVVMTQNIVPQNVLLVSFDPDAPMSKKPEDGFVHWIAQGSIDAAGKIKIGQTLKEYYPPTPPEGDGPHRYQFFVFPYSSDSEIKVGKGRMLQLCFFKAENNLEQPLASTQFIFERT